MKKTMVVFFLAGLFACPKALLAQQFGLDESVRPEVEEVWKKDMKTSFKLMNKIGKYSVLIPKTLNPEPVPAASDRDFGFIPFKRSYLTVTYYNYRPSEQERRIDSLNAFVTQGEFEPITIGLYPLESSNLTVTVSDLSGKDGIIPAENIEITSVRHLLKTYMDEMLEVRPEMLKRGGQTDLKKGVTRTIWLTLKAPENIPGGIYEGKLTLKTGKTPCVIKISVEVLPFKLMTNPDYTVGWFRSPTDDVSIKNYVEHGNVMLSWGLEPVMNYSDGKVTFDFTGSNKMLGMIKKYGLLPYTHQMFVLNFANDLIFKYKIPEFSPEFNRLYKDIMSQLVKWCAENKLRMAYLLVDEPREQALAVWNRKYADTVKYIKLAQEVPGVVTLIDTQDSNFGIDYTPFADMLDILAVHPGPGSIKSIRKCNAGAKAQLWLYNSIRNRSSFGFNTWKWKAKARWEWAYDAGWDMNYAMDFQSWSTYRGGDPGTGIFYPSAIGPVNTPAFEWTREGTDDIKYIYTLEQKSAAAGKSGKPEAVAAGKQAMEMLDAMRKQAPDYPFNTQATSLVDVVPSELQLDDWRYKIGQEILTVDKLMK